MSQPNQTLKIYVGRRENVSIFEQWFVTVLEITDKWYRSARSENAVTKYAFCTLIWENKRENKEGEEKRKDRERRAESQKDQGEEKEEKKETRDRKKNESTLGKKLSETKR